MLIFILGVGLIITLVYLGVNRKFYDGKIDAGICEFKYNALPTKVWSHRAHYGHDTVDGSRSAVQGLLESGVGNFDVDVTCKELSGSDTFEFYVAHPTLVTAGITSIQTVEAFLEQIYRFSEKKNKKKRNGAFVPLITLEMKFKGQKQQADFVSIVQQSPLADRVAVIGSDPETLAGVLPHIHRGGIAAAYRTQPLTDHDYRWPQPTYTAPQKMTQVSSVASKPVAKATAGGTVGDLHSPSNSGDPLQATTVLFPLIAYRPHPEPQLPASVENGGGGRLTGTAVKVHEGTQTLHASAGELADAAAADLHARCEACTNACTAPPGYYRTGMNM